MHFVVGFQFDENGRRVALIHKGRPEWQSGLWNGIGGHVERGETVQAAMEREFVEETGVSQQGIRWKHFADLRTWTHQLVSFFLSFTDQVELVRSVTDEEVFVWGLADLRLPSMKEKLVPNVMWLVELALSMREGRVGGDGRESSSLMVVVEMPPVSK